VNLYHKINAPFKRDMDGTRTGQKGKLIVGEWSRPEFEYLADNEWEFTEKVDGTNIRVHYWMGYEEPELAGRSDAAVIPPPLLDYLRNTFTNERFEKGGFGGVMDNPVTLFGEGYGDKIQGGGKYFDNVRHQVDEKRHFTGFVLFDVKIGDWWLDRDNVEDIAEKLGIESVPVIEHGTLWDAITIVENGRYRHEKFLTSAWGDFEAEGIVARPAVPLFDRMGNRIITKIKAKDFR
jgi:hypothetical protein